MATFKFLNGKGRYHNDNAREAVAEYILNPSKTPSGYIGGIGVDQNDIVGSMDAVAQKFGKTKGVQLRHFVLAFRPDETRDPQQVSKIANEIMAFTGQDYQTIYAVHENTDNLHVHLMLNAISYVDGHRYQGTRKDYYTLVDQVKEALHQNGIRKLTNVSFNSGQDIQD